MGKILNPQSNASSALSQLRSKVSIQNKVWFSRLPIMVGLQMLPYLRAVFLGHCLFLAPANRTRCSCMNTTEPRVAFKKVVLTGRKGELNVMVGIYLFNSPQFQVLWLLCLLQVMPLSARFWWFYSSSSL